MKKCVLKLISCFLIMGGVICLVFFNSIFYLTKIEIEIIWNNGFISSIFLIFLILFNVFRGYFIVEFFRYYGAFFLFFYLFTFICENVLCVGNNVIVSNYLLKFNLLFLIITIYYYY